MNKDAWKPWIKLVEQNKVGKTIFATANKYRPLVATALSVAKWDKRFNMRNHKTDQKRIADLYDRIVAFGPTSKHGTFIGVITNVEYSTEEIIIEYMPDNQPQSKIWQER